MTSWWVADNIFVCAEGPLISILGGIVVRAMIHFHVFSVTLLFGDVEAAAGVGASWVGWLLLVVMGRSDAEVAAGPTEQLGETGYARSRRKAMQPSVCNLSVRVTATLHA